MHIRTLYFNHHPLQTDCLTQVTLHIVWPTSTANRGWWWCARCVRGVCCYRRTLGRSHTTTRTHILYIGCMFYAHDWASEECAYIQPLGLDGFWLRLYIRDVVLAGWQFSWATRANRCTTLRIKTVTTKPRYPIIFGYSSDRLKQVLSSRSTASTIEMIASRE